MDMIDASISFAKKTALNMPPKSEYARWIALSWVKGLGCVNFKKLATHFGDPTQAFSASAAELAEVPDLDHDVIDALLNFSEWSEVGDELRRIERAGATIVAFGDSKYPARLRMTGSVRQRRD